MSINIEIKDNEGKKSELVRKNGDVLLKVATEPLRNFTPSVLVFVDGNGSPSMNQDFTFSGTPIGVHNGTDTTEWTGSNIVGAKVTFDSTDFAHSGTKSVKINKPALNDEFQFSKGSNQDLSSYSALTLYIYITGFWDSGDSVEIFGYDTTTPTEVGNRVALENYININNFDVWMKATIPLIDMGLEGQTIDSFRIDIAQKSGSTPVFYLDDFQIEETSGLVNFIAKPLPEQIIEIEKVNVHIVDDYDSTLLNNSMPNLSYNQILGEPKLNAGITFQSISNGKVIFSTTFTDLFDYNFIGFIVVENICDGTNTYINLELKLSSPLILRSENSDQFQLTFSDDLSGFIRFNTTATGKLRI